MACVHGVREVQSRRGECDPGRAMGKSSYLSAQLRESAPYLRDAGWHQTAALLIAAADEIEQLQSQRAASAVINEPSANENERRLVRKA
jgi:hypothetical protein